MTSTIDKAGRLVIPKVLRDRAGLQPGAELELSFVEGVIRIRSAEPQGRLILKNGLPYWQSPAGTPSATLEEINEAIRESREERSEA